MDKYKVKVTPRAALDIDNIYCYIADEFKAIGSAESHADELENAILSLDTMPYRGTESQTGFRYRTGSLFLFYRQQGYLNKWFHKETAENSSR